MKQGQETNQIRKHEAGTHDTQQNPDIHLIFFIYYYLLNNFKATSFLNFFKLSQLITFYSAWNM